MVLLFDPSLTETRKVSGFPMVARITKPRPVWGFSFGRGSSLELEFVVVRPLWVAAISRVIIVVAE